VTVVKAATDSKRNGILICPRVIGTCNSLKKSTHLRFPGIYSAPVLKTYQKPKRIQPRLFDVLAKSDSHANPS